ncbi:MAG: hypothetical protein NTNFB02_32800 [Nitrospira sp.]
MKSVPVRIVGMVRWTVAVAFLIALQGCHSPITQSVMVNCGEAKPGGSEEPGAPCQKTDVAVNSDAPSNSVVINNSGQPTGDTLESLPGTEKCTWTGGQNKKCTNPGQANCSFYPNKTCKTTWNKDNGRCDCACM